MAEWRTIDDSDPELQRVKRDGTRILVINKDDGPDSVEITEWFVCSRFVYIERPDGLFERREETYFEGWNGNGHRATHWQPLPAPPEE